MNRRQEREQAFILIFEKAFRPDVELDDIFEMAEESEFMIPSVFSKELAILVYDNIELIDKEVQAVSIGWNTSRMSKVALAIIRLAVAEIKFKEDIPVSVSINEAVELTKKFASPEDASFVNGVLGTIARQQEG